MKKIILTLTAIITLQSLFAQNPEQLKSWLPEISGWELMEEIEIFNADNLFDRINGAAPLFIENNFREMTSMEYRKGDEYITIQAYRHATPEDAFGMYASERSADLEHADIGGEAQGDAVSLFFFAGNIYVKMWTNSNDDLQETLHTIGTSFSGKIDPDAGYPDIVKQFPDKGKIPYSEAYITSSYIGHEFLKSVYTARYNLNGQEIQLFIVDAKSKEGANNTLKSYLTFTKQSFDLTEGNYIIKDRYNGDIPVLWKGQYIIGVYNQDGDQVKDADKIIAKVAEKL